MYIYTYIYIYIYIYVYIYVYIIIYKYALQGRCCPRFLAHRTSFESVRPQLLRTKCFSEWPCCVGVSECVCVCVWVWVCVSVCALIQRHSPPALILESHEHDMFKLQVQGQLKLSRFHLAPPAPHTPPHPPPTPHLPFPVPAISWQVGRRKVAVRSY